MTVTGTTWRERLADPTNLSADGVAATTRSSWRRRAARSPASTCSQSNWFESAVVKISGMPERQVDHFDEQVAFVLSSKREEAANDALLDVHLLDRLRDERAFAEADLRDGRHNGALSTPAAGSSSTGTATRLDASASTRL